MTQNPIRNGEERRKVREEFAGNTTQMIGARVLNLESGSRKRGKRGSCRQTRREASWKLTHMTPLN